MMSSTESGYRVAFERLWDEHSSHVVSNGKTEHAAALFSVFLNRAKKNVVFFCKELRDVVYDDEEVLSALDGAIARGVRIDVLVQDRSSKNSRFAEELRGAMTDGKLVFFFEELPEPQKSMPFNFAYADNHAFRFEADRQEPKGVAAAWNERTVNLLQNLFGSIKTSVSHATRDPASGLSCV